MKVLYFAWVRERIGLAEEEISLPPDVETVAELVEWLAARGEAYAAAFANRKGVRAALDRTHALPQTAIGSAREIAFFPPMTGG
jgi:molybdopterin synthase sulfur carrier subunit